MDPCIYMRQCDLVFTVTHVRQFCLGPCLSDQSRRWRPVMGKYISIFVFPLERGTLCFGVTSLEFSASWISGWRGAPFVYHATLFQASSVPLSFLIERYVYARWEEEKQIIARLHILLILKSLLIIWTARFCGVSSRPPADRLPRESEPGQNARENSLQTINSFHVERRRAPSAPKTFFSVEFLTTTRFDYLLFLKGKQNVSFKIKSSATFGGKHVTGILEFSLFWLALCLAVPPVSLEWTITWNHHLRAFFS